jgi:hypothetical protein
VCLIGGVVRSARAHSHPCVSAPGRGAERHVQHEGGERLLPALRVLPGAGLHRAGERARGRAGAAGAAGQVGRRRLAGAGAGPRLLQDAQELQ